jgi:secreted trypsin-like serine protease
MSLFKKILLISWTCLLALWTVYLYRPSTTWVNRSKNAEAALVKLRTPPSLSDEQRTPKLQLTKLLDQSLQISEFIRTDPPQAQLDQAKNLFASTTRQAAAAAAQSSLGLVFRGARAPQGLLPYQAAVIFSNYVPVAAWGYHCGGVLINASWVLTAGHCFSDDTEPGDYQVYMGSLQLSASNQPSACCWSKLVKIVRDPDFRQVTTQYGGIFDHDDALLQLSTPMSNPNISPISVADPTIEKDIRANGSLGTVSGWGVTASGGDPSNDLMYGTVKLVVPDSACGKTYGTGIIQSDMLCTTPAVADACQGDSGGPLVMKTTSASYVTGIVSWGYPPGGCPSTKPTVYGRVSAFSDWIGKCVMGAACPSSIKPSSNSPPTTK